MTAVTEINAHRRKNWEYEHEIAGGGIVYVTDKYDDAFSEGLLQEIAALFNNGVKIEKLMDKFNRPYMEMLYALLYLADKGKISRPFAFRKQ